MIEIGKKVSLAVYLYYNRDARKVAKLGDVIYHSKRFRYVILYVNQEDALAIQEDLSGQKFVKAVEPSAWEQIDQDFVGSLHR